MSIEEQEIIDLEPIIAAPSEKHLACVLLLDVSGSMSGEPIQQLNNAINLFKEKVSKDETAQKTVDIAIITFGSTVEIVQTFTPVMEMDRVSLEVSGSTMMGAGLVKAVNLLKERNRFYNSLGTPVFKPWIFVVSDGGATDSMSEAVKLVKQEEAKGKLKVIALGVKGYSPNVFASFTNRIIELADYNFDKIFDWVAESMVTISVSKVNNENGDNVALKELPDNSRVIPKSW
jgi:uncharacterized protein YegL